MDAPVFVGVHELSWDQEDRGYVAKTIFGVQYLVWEEWDQGDSTGEWGMCYRYLNGYDGKWSKAVMRKSADAAFRALPSGISSAR